MPEPVVRGSTAYVPAATHELRQGRSRVILAAEAASIVVVRDDAIRELDARAIALAAELAGKF